MSDRCWILKVSSTSPSCEKSLRTDSDTASPTPSRSAFASSGVRVASTPRRLPSSVCFATVWISCWVRPRKRSTAWSSPPSGSPAIFTVAMPSTSSGIIPADSAFLTVTSMGMVFSEMRDTVSMSGRRKPRPPG